MTYSDILRDLAQTASPGLWRRLFDNIPLYQFCSKALSSLLSQRCVLPQSEYKKPSKAKEKYYRIEPPHGHGIDNGVCHTSLLIVCIIRWSHVLAFTSWCVVFKSFTATVFCMPVS
jgi:hypothetical protein